MTILKRFKRWRGKFVSTIFTVSAGTLVLICIMRIFTTYGENAVILATVATTYVTVNVLLLRIESLTIQVSALRQTKTEEITR